MKPSQKLKLIREKREAIRHYSPFVSVIVTTYNQKPLLELSLRALFKQDYPKDKYEIVVADDGSSDGTKELSNNLAKISPVPLKYCFQEDKGFRAGQARNLGAKNSQGDLLLFLDADIISDRNLISAHAKAQAKYDVVCGYAAGHRNEDSVDLKKVASLLEGETNSLKSSLILKEGREFIFSNDYYKKSSHNEHVWEFFHSNNFSIKKNKFLKFQFDERFVGWGEEDIELAYRLFKAGNSFVFEKNCYSIHYENRKPGMVLNYTPDKISSQIRNMGIFYKIHPSEEIKNYIIRRFTYLPDELLTKEHDIVRILDINKAKNLDLLRREYNQNKTKLDSYPTRIYVELTKNCNMCCKMCLRRNSRIQNSSSNNMEFSLFKRVAYEFFPYADFVDLRGFGESLLYPHINEAINLCSRFNCDFGLLTNLSVDNDDLLELLIKNGFWIGVSIDGPNEEVYGRIRNKESFAQVIKNLRYIVDISKKHKYDTNKLYFLVSVQKDNIKELPMFVDLAKEIGVKRIELNQVLSDDPEIAISDIETLAKDKINETISASKQKGVDIVITSRFFDDSFVSHMANKHELKCPPQYSHLFYEGYKFHKRCSKGYSHLFIAHDGKIGPCNHLLNFASFGDISGKSSADKLTIMPPFREQWNNGLFIEFRRKLNTDTLPGPCAMVKCINRQYPINFS